MHPSTLISLVSLTLTLLPGTRAYEQSLDAQDAATTPTISPALFHELEELSRLVDITYCVTDRPSLGIHKPFRCLSRCADFPDFELIQTWNTGAWRSDSCGYVAVDHGQRRLVVAFRGTYSLVNTIADLTTMPQEYQPYPGDPDEDSRAKVDRDSLSACVNCTVHAGFYQAWRNTKREILDILLSQVSMHPKYRLDLIGHSLGGAVAALAGLELASYGLDPIVTTYGEPRVGNAAFATYFDHAFNMSSNNTSSNRFRRVTHTHDPVPLLPLTEWNYFPHAGELFITKSSLPPDVTDIRVCVGAADARCIAGQDDSLLQPSESLWKKMIKRVPARFRAWELLTAHRDYFYRLGLCVPGGDGTGMHSGSGDL